jgi:tRNA/tmRNA/rRNA uracil-C5-methylase (TrmA/RlmC/RlmD family)
VSDTGTELELVIGAPAHGGSCVAHGPDGRVVFVRHALPGERVRARVTAEHSKYLQAEAISVLEASPDRVDAPCVYAHPGGCGGCDLQHVSLPAQREWKAGIVREQLSRLAGVELAVTVEALPDVDPERPGLGWRTRVGYAVDRAGRAGLHPYRSRAVLPVETCLLGHPDLARVDVPHRKWAGAAAVDVASDDTGGFRLTVTRQRGPGHIEGPKALHQKVAGHTFAVRGFWQVHPAAADALSAAVLAAVQVQPGERAVDLYAGAGLFAAVLADAGASVVAVEGDRNAAEDAVANLKSLEVEVWHGPVEESLADPELGAVDIVVLDPPRTGAGREIVARIAALGPRAVAYVACDPAALARDVAYFAAQGYALTSLRAFDCFPMTHHVECVALLSPLA